MTQKRKPTGFPVEGEFPVKRAGCGLKPSIRLLSEAGGTVLVIPSHPLLGPTHADDDVQHTPPPDGDTEHQEPRHFLHVVTSEYGGPAYSGPPFSFLHDIKEKAN
jgi:hypothetical protein